jgi:hypothetical protein
MTDQEYTAYVNRQDQAAAYRAKRCPSTYPGAVTFVGGRLIRCTQPAGHEGRHGHGFAARYWDDVPVQAPVCANCTTPVPEAWNAVYIYTGSRTRLCARCLKADTCCYQAL